jgi:alpha-methylacyl-CoA racemase
MGRWPGGRGENLLDGGAPFYGVYATADARHVSIGALEPRFYAELIQRMGLDPASLPGQYDTARWPELRARLTEAFRSKTRDAWCALLEGTDACFAPVLTLDEARTHPHNVHRGTIVEVGGVHQPAPAPRFGGARVAVERRAAEGAAAILSRWT